MHELAARLACGEEAAFAELYDACADAFRNTETVLHSFATFTQLASIEGATLRAPEGEHDDRADSYALACVAMSRCPQKCFPPRFLGGGWRRC